MNLYVRMKGRNADEEHRSSSPLDLLFDLTFVVAIAQLAAQFSNHGGKVTGPEKVGPYLMVFFAIWWAWISFTWFASAYDTDDWLYRVFAVAQMAGVLVLAAGVPMAFQNGDFRVIAAGYLAMRIALAAQWLRVAVEHVAGRSTARRYLLGMALAELSWIMWLLLPQHVRPITFVGVVAIELTVPIWAERPGTLPWHPGHIAERYGEFVILLLGESVLAVANGVHAALSRRGVTPNLVYVSLGGLLLLVGLWWTYFLEPTLAGLIAHRKGAFFWGWGHFLLFAALAAVGAWLEVAVAAVSQGGGASDVQVAYGLASPVAIVLLMIWVVNLPFSELPTVSGSALLPAAAAVLAIPLALKAIGLSAVVAIVAMVVSALVAIITNNAGSNGEPENDVLPAAD